MQFFCIFFHADFCSRLWSETCKKYACFFVTHVEWPFSRGVDEREITHTYIRLFSRVHKSLSTCLSIFSSKHMHIYLSLMWNDLLIAGSRRDRSHTRIRLFPHMDVCLSFDISNIKHIFVDLLIAGSMRGRSRTSSPRFSTKYLWRAACRRVCAWHDPFQFICNWFDVIYCQMRNESRHTYTNAKWVTSHIYTAAGCRRRARRGWFVCFTHRVWFVCFTHRVWFVCFTHMAWQAACNIWTSQSHIWMSHVKESCHTYEWVVYEAYYIQLYELGIHEHRQQFFVARSLPPCICVPWLFFAEESLDEGIALAVVAKPSSSDSQL